MGIPVSAFAMMTLMALSLSPSPSSGLEIIGRISSIDLERDRITLESGQILEIPDDNVLFSLGEGTCVAARYENKDSHHLVSDITVLQRKLDPFDATRYDDPCTEMRPLRSGPPSSSGAPISDRKRFKFRERPLRGEAAGKVIKPLRE